MYPELIASNNVMNSRKNYGKIAVTRTTWSTFFWIHSPILLTYSFYPSVCVCVFYYDIRAMQNTHIEIK